MPTSLLQSTSTATLITCVSFLDESEITVSTDISDSGSSGSSPAQEYNETVGVSIPSTWREKYWPPIIKGLSWLMVLMAFFGALWAVTPERFSPGEGEFGLVLTLLLCFAAEALFVKIPTPEGFPPLPSLLASLVMGLALANLPTPVNIASDIDPNTSSILRQIALTILLTQSGLEIEPEAIVKVKYAVARLAFLPCIGETAVIGLLGYVLLDFPIIWSLMLGFMMAAVSSAVVIPSMIIFQKKGLGTNKGIPSFIMAASGIDDVMAISGFTLLLGLALPTGLEKDFVEPSDNNSTFSTNSTNTTGLPPTITDTSNIGKQIGSAIIQIIIGIVLGVVLGFILSVIPPRKMRFKTFCRGFLLLSTGILFVFGTSVWGIPGAGSLCALIMSFVASIRWGKEKEPLGQAWHFMWKIFQPVLFGLTGGLVKFSMMDGDTILMGLIVLGTALFVRMIISSGICFGLKFTFVEKLFVAISWMPKGTVQAALGSLAMDQAIALDRPQAEIIMGQQILVLAVVITLITAPTGAFAISLAGPRLLHESPVEQSSGVDNKAYHSNDRVVECQLEPVTPAEMPLPGYSELNLMSVGRGLDKIEEENECSGDKNNSGKNSDDDGNDSDGSAIFF